MGFVTQHLQRRSGIYHLRCRVPLDLVGKLRRREIRRSLGTSDPRQAKATATLLYAFLLQEFEKIRAINDPNQEWEDILIDIIGRLEELLELQKTAHAAEVRGNELKHLIELNRIAIDRKNWLDQVIPKSRKIFEVTMHLIEEKKAGKLSGGADTIKQVEQMLSNLGMVNKKMKTPSVSTFLDTVFVNEKKLQDDANRHVKNYIMMFAKITEDKNLSEYTRADILQWVGKLENIKNSIGKSVKD